MSTVELRTLSLERYKGYAQRAKVEFAPLTILVGSNNAGKTALAQAIQLIAGGLVHAEDRASEPLPFESGGIKHADTFADLVTGRSVHGRLRMAAGFVDETVDLHLSAIVREVVAPPRPSSRQIAEWCLRSGSNRLSLLRVGFDDHSEYEVDVSGTARPRRPILWRGLMPWHSRELAAWIEGRIKALQGWAAGVRHLRCPRILAPSPFIVSDPVPVALGPGGVNVPLILAANDALRKSVQEWYRSAFGEAIDVATQGIYSQLVAGAPAHGETVPLTQSGRGLSHVLPVVVMALSARDAGPGVDVIEHPEAELHPAAHAHVAELLLENLTGSTRPLVVETHSEMVLLRARRWVAEGRLPSESIIIYWVYTDLGRGSVIRKIRVNDSGELDEWPEGVFIEDYDEILAIRRAARPRLQ